MGYGVLEVKGNQVACVVLVIRVRKVERSLQ